MIRGAIFDLDGTLLNTLPTIAAHCNQTLSSHGLCTFAPDRYREFVGAGARVLLRRALAAAGVTDPAYADALLPAYVAAYDADPFRDTVPYGGIDTLLCALTERCVPIAILSNKPTSSVRLLASHFFDVPFTHVLGAPEEPSHLKPSPFVALSIASDWGIACKDILYVGDSTIDMQTAKNAAFGHPVAAAWGFSAKQELAQSNVCVADTPDDVTALIEKERGGRR